MGKLTILITGASGYVGRYAVAEARARKHHVVAHVRRAESALPEWHDDPMITIACADLTDQDDGLLSLVEGVDAVIHAAASLAGDESQQKRDTLNATNALTAAIAQSTSKPRLVLISSIAVYDGRNRANSIDETSPLEGRPDLRDLYCRTKLLQETQASQIAKTAGFELWILRAGAVFGPSRLWNAHVGLSFGPLCVRLGKRGQIPLIYVEHCAEILVKSAETKVRETPDGSIEIMNVVDDGLPDRVRFLAAVSKAGWPKYVLPLSWHVFAAAAVVLQNIPGVRSRLPGLLRLPVLRARMRPLTYGNARLHQRLNWTKGQSFETVMAASIEAEKANSHG